MDDTTNQQESNLRPAEPATTAQPTVQEPQPNEPATSSEPPEPTAEATNTPLKPSKSNKKRWIIVAVLLLVVIGGVAAYVLTRSDASQPKAVVVKTATVKKTATTTPLVTTWNYLPQAKDLGDLSWFSNLGAQFGYECLEGQTECTTPSIKASDITYAQIATTKDGKPVIVAYYIMGEMSFAYYAIETSPNNYTVLGTVSNITNGNSKEYVQQRINDFKKNTSSNVMLDETMLPEEYVFPDSVSFKGMNYVGTFNEYSPSGYFTRSLADIRGSFFATKVADKDITVIGTDKSHTYYLVTASDKPLYKIQEVYGATDAYYAKSYKVVDPIISDKAAPITWNDGTKNTSIYVGRNAGCGSSNGYLVAKNVTDKDLVVVGKTDAGVTLYQLANDNPLLIKEFTEDYAKGESLETAAYKNLTVDGFQKIHGLVVAKNAMGEYVVYLKSDLFVGGGCAKPVIYLYPQSIQSVNVAVGATVTVSDPVYPTGGWRNVLAFPDSRLLYEGKGYDSLFWEGTGLGDYPIVRAGTVVPTAQATSTIRSQLAAQGFNAKETADFLAYWQPKLPSTPYVRLTWLTTDQMNALAPLTITPRPQTVIRAFLQFNGLEQPIAIPPQHFTAPIRSGFTVTEWGGLLK